MSANYSRHTDREPHKALFACGSHRDDRVDTEVLLIKLKKKGKTKPYQGPGGVRRIYPLVLH